MGEQQYFTLNLSNVRDDQEDLITSLLFENDAQGVQEDLQFEQLDRKYQPKIIEQENKTLTAYFLESPSPILLKELAEQYSNVQLSQGEHPIQDWLAEWKSQWKPFELIEGIWVVPDWHREEFAGREESCLFIEPGMAFGTGTHATTQLASMLMAELVEQQKINSFLDVGTGSGILALLADKLSIKTIAAYDNDPESERVFQENCEKNLGKTLPWIEDWSTQLAGQMDLTLANIIDGVLLDLKSEFQKMKSPFYIFTGVLAERRDLFLQEMTENWNLELLSEKQKDEWVGFCFKAPS